MGGVMNENFLNGFTKQAKLEEDHKANSVVDGAIGFLPLGTTLSTAFGKRPEGHSRLNEFEARLGGSVLGGLAGSGVGALTKNPSISALLGTAGAFAGEAGASHLINKKHYDGKGKLKK
jgi:hypothetical protein